MSCYNFVLFLVICFGILRGRCSLGQTIAKYQMKIDCKTKTITTTTKFKVTMYPKSLELFECVINSPIVNDLKNNNISVAFLVRLDLTYMTTYTALDDKYMDGLTIHTLTVKSRTKLPARIHSLYPLKNLTNLELTNVVPPDIPDGLINLTLREINTFPVTLSSCKNLKQLNIIDCVTYIYEGFLVNCTNLTTVFIQFGEIRFTLGNLFDNSNISLDYLEIHDNPILLNKSILLPMQLSAFTFSSITGLKKLNLSYNKIWSISDDTFTRLHGLEVLDLSHNDLFDFDVDNVTNIQTLILSYNPLSKESICRIFNKTKTSYPLIKNLIIDVCANVTRIIDVCVNATASFEQSWTVISQTPRDKNFNDTTNNDCKNYVLVRHHPPEKIWEGPIPCIATSVAVLACIGFFCTVAYLHKREKKELEKKRLKKEENMMKLKLSTEILDAGVEKTSNEPSFIVDKQTTRL